MEPMTLRERVARALNEQDRIETLCAVKPYDELSEGRRDKLLRNADTAISVVVEAAARVVEAHSVPALVNAYTAKGELQMAAENVRQLAEGK